MTTTTPPPSSGTASLTVPGSVEWAPAVTQRETVFVVRVDTVGKPN